MKTTSQRWSSEKDGQSELKELKYSVTNFLKSNGSLDENRRDRRAKLVKRKSRKLLRKETRKLKKVQRKCHHMRLPFPNECEKPANKTTDKETKTETTVIKSTGSLNAASQKTHKTNVVRKDAEANPKRKVHFSEDVPKQKKKSKPQEGRKRGLKEANIEEDKEIKRLEKCLGFNKRKNKNTLPLSLVNDGLDYILGIFQPGGSATGLYESDEEMGVDKAKDNFDGLEEDGEGEMTDEEKKDDSKGEIDMDSEEVDTQTEDVKDAEDSTQEDDEEEDEEESDIDSSEANDDEADAESEQRSSESKKTVCHSKSVSFSFLLF